MGVFVGVFLYSKSPHTLACEHVYCSVSHTLGQVCAHSPVCLHAVTSEPAVLPSRGVFSCSELPLRCNQRSAAGPALLIDVS